MYGNMDSNGFLPQAFDSSKTACFGLITSRSETLLSYLECPNCRIIFQMKWVEGCASLLEQHSSDSQMSKYTVGKPSLEACSMRARLDGLGWAP